MDGELSIASVEMTIPLGVGGREEQQQRQKQIPAG
jgi:hypothetical protein